MPGCKKFLKVIAVKFLMDGKPHATKLDIYVINKVKAMREERGMSQIALSQALGMAESFVSNVESVKRRDKYNLNHLNLLAKEFGCSPREFLPENNV
jgi:transcriptional regulator with XRE-family HTH domain